MKNGWFPDHLLIGVCFFIEGEEWIGRGIEGLKIYNVKVHRNSDSVIMSPVTPAKKRSV